MASSDRKLAASRRREAAAAHKRSQQIRMKAVRLSAAIILIAAVFCLGFFLRGFEPLTTRLGLSGISGTTTTATSSAVKTTYDSLSPRVAEVEDLLKANSFDTYNLDYATERMLTALVGAVDDSYMRYFTQERYEQYIQENLSKDYQGIGVLFGEYEGSIYAADVFSGSSADLAGVQVGDTVQAIDGTTRNNWTVNEVTSIISSKGDDSVVITWSRPASMGASSTTTFTTTLQCQKYEEPNVTASLTDEVGYIKIVQLSQTSGAMMKSAVQQLQSQGARALVLDLRDCSGGYLNQAVEIASLFVKSGTLVQIKTNSATTNKTASGEQISALPMVVLINSKTAGTAEVLAAALRDNGVAQLIGSTTLGKGSVQVVKTLSFGGAIRYTAAYYLSPLGHDINDLGVSPDIVVGDESTQLDVAQQTALSLISSAAAS